MKQPLTWVILALLLVSLAGNAYCLHVARSTYDYAATLDDSIEQQARNISELRELVLRLGNASDDRDDGLPGGVSERIRESVRAEAERRQQDEDARLDAIYAPLVARDIESRGGRASGAPRQAATVEQP